MSPAFVLLAIGWCAFAPAPFAQEPTAAVPRAEALRRGPWFALGPFDNPRGVDVSQDPGVDRLVRRMKVGQPWSGLRESFGGRGKARLGWRPVEPGPASPPPGAGPFDTGTLDLRTLLDAPGAQGDNAAGYLYCTIEADEARAVEVTCGSDDGLRLWLNGELLIDRAVPRPLHVTDERLSLTLASGLNHLLVKVTNGGGGWAFAMLEPRPVTQAETDAAIERGIARLLELQLLDGSWAEHQGDYPDGQTGLAVYTLLECGVSPRHSAILQAVENLRRHPGQKTYALACQILALAALHDPEQLDWLRAQCERLRGWQNRNGGWGYPGTQSDLSNTHLAAFSLRAAARSGVEVPEALWNDVAGYALRNQERRKRNAGAGFTYFPGHGTGITGSMTVAGLTLLACAHEALGERMTAGLRQQLEPAIEAGLAWLREHWSVTGNPNKADWHLYYLYGLERVGGLLDLERIGPHDWYAEGADVLVPLQDAEGGWGFQYDTCFALLFLRRATARAVSAETRDERLFATAEGDGPLRLRVKAGTPATLWIDAPQLAAGRELVDVEFFLRPEGGDWRRLTVAAGELALRHELDPPGRWQARAEVVLDDGTRLVSSLLDITHEEGLAPEPRDYAGDSLRNRMPALEPAVRASSELEPATNAADNRVWTRWLCQESDADPWIEIDPARSAVVARLVLTHARTTRADDRHASPRPRRVELWLNREKTPRLVDVDPDPRRKTTVEFSPPLTLSRLRLRVLALEGGELGRAAVGFAEIEVQEPDL